MNLDEALKVCLANTFAFYLKAHYFHWNVEGAHFAAYHKFFQKIYEDAFDAVDAIAEHIRTLDAYAPGSFVRYNELKTIEDEIYIPPALSMMAKLLEDNAKVTESLKAAFAIADSQKMEGIANFLADRIDTHAKHGWMIKAHLKGL